MNTEVHNIFNFKEVNYFSVPHIYLPLLSNINYQNAKVRDDRNEIMMKIKVEIYFYQNYTYLLLKSTNLNTMVLFFYEYNNTSHRHWN